MQISVSSVFWNCCNFWQEKSTTRRIFSSSVSGIKEPFRIDKLRTADWHSWAAQPIIWEKIPNLSGKKCNETDTGQRTTTTTELHERQAGGRPVKSSSCGEKSVKNWHFLHRNCFLWFKCYKGQRRNCWGFLFLFFVLLEWHQYKSIAGSW